MKLYILSTTIKSLCFLLFFIVVGVQSVSAQTISVNQNGEKIILYNDGSWRYFDAENPDDIALLNDSNISQKVDKKVKKKTPKAKKPKKDKVARVKKPKEKKLKQEKVAKSKKAKPKKKKPSNSKEGYALKSKNKKPKKPIKEPKNKPKYSTPSITSSSNYRSIINKEIIDIRAKQNMALEKERVASFAAQKYERELKVAKKRKLDKASLKSIEAKYKEAKLQLNLARNQNKVLLKQRRSYEAILKKEPQVYAKEYAKLADKYNKDFDLVPTYDEEDLAVSKTRKKANRTKKTIRKKDKPVVRFEESNINFAEESEKEYLDTEVEYADRPSLSANAYQVSYPSNKPDVSKAATQNCVVAFEGKDSFSGKKRKDLAKSPFFSYTSDKLRSYFEEGDMIQCDAYMSAVSGGYKFVCIEVLIASETAQRSYGSIEKQGQLAVKLVDGTTINLYNNKTDYGFLDPLKKTVLYKAQYRIPNEHVKTLSKVDIDKVRLVWSTGYEDYTIYETDFLINQLNCLNQ